MTKKELIEEGWIDKYLLGLTTEPECHEVERLANLYPEVQAEINQARNRICGKFNRNLTQPALRHSFISKRRLIIGSGIALAILLSVLAFLYNEHSSLKEHFQSQAQQLAVDEAKLSQIASFSKIENERSDFLHASHTNRIRLKGCQLTPDAEVMVFHSRFTGKMMLRVIELPELMKGQHYEVWAKTPDQDDRLLGKISPPIRFDSLYALDPALHISSLHISIMDPVTLQSEPICLASVTK